MKAMFFKLSAHTASADNLHYPVVVDLALNACCWKLIRNTAEKWETQKNRVSGNIDLYVRYNVGCTPSNNNDYSKSVCEEQRKPVQFQ